MSLKRFLTALMPPASVLWLMIGLLIGGLVGGFVALRWIAPPQTWLGYVGQSFLLTQLASAQYEEADYPAAKAALEDYLAYLEDSEPREGRWQPGHEPWLDERGLAFDKALTAGRLALLEERQDNHATAAEFWARAEEYARKAQWRDPSRENLRRFLQRLDELGDADEETSAR